MSQYNGRKIESHHENPLDNHLINMCDMLVPSCKQHSITPNMITIYRIILSIFVIYDLFFTCNIAMPIIGTAVFYFLDCLDGYLARATDQITILGDILDHVSDVSFFISFIVFLVVKQYDNKIFIIGGLVVLTTMMMLHFGLQQKLYVINNPDRVEGEEILDRINHFHNVHHDHIHWTRYFGCGTLYLYILICIYYVQSNCK